MGPTAGDDQSIQTGLLLSTVFSMVVKSVTRGWDQVPDLPLPAAKLGQSS